MKKNRKADLSKKVDPNADNIEDDVKTPQGKHDVGMKEAFEGLFEGHDLSEEFKEKVAAVFEAAIHEKVLEEKAALEEQFKKDLEEQVAEVTEELAENIDGYLDYVSEKWLESNEVAIESSIKVEMAESLLNGIKGLIAEHNVEIDENTVDVVSEAEAKAERATQKYNEVVEEIMAIREEKEALERQIAFAEVSEGLTDTQIDRLSVLAEGVSAENVEVYKNKVAAIKESYFAESTATTADETEYLEESEEITPTASIDPTVAKYVESIGRLAK